MDLPIVLEEIIVLNLGDFVNACLLRDVLGSRRLGLEVVCLNLDLVLLGALFSLLGEEVSQVDLDARGGAGAQVVGRGLVLALLELDQLGLDHLHLLDLALSFDSYFFLLGWSHVCLYQVHIVSVASEDSLVVHNVESVSVVFFENRLDLA